MQTWNSLGAKLAAIVIGMSLVILTIAALRFLSLYALAIGLLGSAGLGFYFSKRFYPFAPAIIVALVIVPVVYFLSMLLIVNIIGE